MNNFERDFWTKVYVKAIGKGNSSENSRLFADDAVAGFRKSCKELWQP